MRESWRFFGISVAVLAATLVVGHLLVPGIVPVAYAQEPQPSWAVVLAFALRALEFLAGWIALISLALSLAIWTWRQFRRS